MARKEPKSGDRADWKHGYRRYSKAKSASGTKLLGEAALTLPCWYSACRAARRAAR
jgi:hypothetical protein